MSVRKMHADEVDIDPALARRLVAERFPEWSELRIEPVLPWGTDNALYRLGDAMVLRLPRHEPRVETLEKECVWLPKLAPLLPLAVPVPLAVGTPALCYPFPWAVYRWLDGQTATEGRFDDPGQAAIDLAAFITALQGIDPREGPAPGTHNVMRGEPIQARDASVRGALAALEDEVDVDAATTVWEAALRAPDWDAPPVWIHGDLDSRNLLVDGGRLSAVIDFGCLGVGDPACDVMVAWKVFGEDARNRFRAALSVDDATWARARGWALSQALGALAYYTLETNAVLVREARRWLAEVLPQQV